MIAVSVACTVLNEVDDIDALLESLMRQSLAPAEVVIVDGGSIDGTWERLQAAQGKYANLIAIRDESCNLRRCAGPIARGRNIAISATRSEVVACADAGCTYDPDWLRNLTAPIFVGESDYSVGGAFIDTAHSSVWDVAAAPFMGVKLDRAANTKSCTARSVAFRKELWLRAGGFPENIFLGEDTVFDFKVRELVTPAFATHAKALYQPRHTFGSALRQMIGYSVTDGVLGRRTARLWRNIARCLAEILAVLVLALFHWAVPLMCVLALEIYFAFRLDWSEIRKVPLPTMAARLGFSLMIPWVVAWYQTTGAITKKNLPNRQNFI